MGRKDGRSGILRHRSMFKPWNICVFHGTDFLPLENS
jgi:hypothetical protein